MCPFRTDCLKGWLGAERAKEISDADKFVCHKNNKRQCSGSMQMNKEGNLFVRIAKFKNIPLELSGKEKLFDSKEEMIEHHRNSTDEL